MCYDAAPLWPALLPPPHSLLPPSLKEKKILLMFFFHSYERKKSSEFSIYSPLESRIFSNFYSCTSSHSCCCCCCSVMMFLILFLQRICTRLHWHKKELEDWVIGLFDSIAFVFFFSSFSIIFSLFFSIWLLFFARSHFSHISLHDQVGKDVLSKTKKNTQQETHVVLRNNAGDVRRQFLKCCTRSGTWAPHCHHCLSCCVPMCVQKESQREKKKKNHKSQCPVMVVGWPWPPPLYTTNM